MSRTKAEDTFLYGGCASFALALRGEIGGDIHALERDGKQVHVFVKLGDKNYDVKGARSTYAMAVGLYGHSTGITVSGVLTRDKITTKAPTEKLFSAAQTYIRANKNQFGGATSKLDLATLFKLTAPVPARQIFSYAQENNVYTRCQCSAVALVKSERMPPTKIYVLKTERVLSVKLKRVFAVWSAKLAGEISSAMRKADKTPKEIVDQIISDLSLKGYSVAMLDAVREDLLSAFAAGGISGLDLIGMRNDASIVNLVNENAVTFARERAAELVGMKWDSGSQSFAENPNAGTSITETTRDGLRSAVTDAIERGDSTDDLASAISDSYGFSDARAETIARTELAHAHVQGNLDAWDQSGVVSGKESILADTHPQEDVCDDNEAAGVIDLDGEFPSGDEGPPYHPNCLCALLPVLSEDSTAEN